jgi:hypothetical protein
MEPRVDCCRNEALPLGQTNDGLQIKFTEWTRDDRPRQPVFLESGKTKMRTKWFGNRQAKELQIQEPFNRADCREEYPPDAGTRFLLFT